MSDEPQGVRDREAVFASAEAAEAEARQRLERRLEQEAKARRLRDAWLDVEGRLSRVCRADNERIGYGEPIGFRFEEHQLPIARAFNAFCTEAATQGKYDLLDGLSLERLVRAYGCDFDGNPELAAINAGEALAALRAGMAGGLPAERWAAYWGRTPARGVFRWLLTLVGVLAGQSLLQTPPDTAPVAAEPAAAACADGTAPGPEAEGIEVEPPRTPAPPASRGAAAPDESGLSEEIKAGRDYWMWKEYQSRTGKSIRLELQRIAAEKGWEPLSEDRMVQTAVRRFCEHYDLSQPIKKPRRRKKPRR
jgi:hypothetical protein